MESFRFQVRFNESTAWIQRFKILVQVYSYFIFEFTVTAVFTLYIWFSYPQWHNTCQKDPAPILAILLPVICLACLIVRWERQPSDLFTLTIYVVWVTLSITVFGFCGEVSKALVAHIISVALFTLTSTAAFFDNFDENRDDRPVRRYAMLLTLGASSLVALLAIAASNPSAVTHIMLSAYTVFLNLFMILFFWMTQRHHRHLWEKQIIQGSLTLYVSYYALFQVTFLMLIPEIWHVPFNRVFSSFSWNNAQVKT
ncbi:Ja192 [Japanese cytomegalovirus]|nr:Ja192 [Japanese cytomegalovirus]